MKLTREPRNPGESQQRKAPGFLGSRVKLKSNKFQNTFKLLFTFTLLLAAACNSPRPTPSPPSSDIPQSQRPEDEMILADPPGAPPEPLLIPREDLPTAQELPAEHPPSETSKSRCERSQQEIFGVLAKHLRPLSACVQGRGPKGLQTLRLDFTVTPDGSMKDIEVQRTAPLEMRSCLKAALSAIPFPLSGGDDCPVSIPIKTGD